MLARLRTNRIPWILLATWIFFCISIIWTVIIANNRRSGFTGMDASRLQELRIELNKHVKVHDDELHLEARD